MKKFNWMEITREDVLKAIDLYQKNGQDCPASRSTFLIYDNKELPAKHIRGIAYKIHYNQNISKHDYGGGVETARFFQRLGFEIKHSVCVEHKKEKSQGNKGSITLQNEEIKQASDTPISDSKKQKIKIPGKDVITQKNALQLYLNGLFDGDIVCEKTFPWLKTPETPGDDYKELIQNLALYRGNTTFEKKNVALRCDFVCESQKLIIEYDERQHFSQARKISLLSYTDILLDFDREKWIQACEDIQAKDNTPPNRDESRAYYDSTRDIEARRNGYKLIRIMHGQVDLESELGKVYLENLFKFDKNCKSKVDLKIGLYLQTDDVRNPQEFKKAMNLVKKSDIDIFVFPEMCYTPFNDVMENIDLAVEKDANVAYDYCLELSRQIDRAVIVNSIDCYGAIYSVYANHCADSNETECKIYVKHTATSSSAFEFDYASIAENLFAAIDFRGYKIGMTICYDCNFALFSRIYGLQNVDVLINSTGGNVIYDKWYKYNQVRSIENNCYSFITMGGGNFRNINNPNSFVFGFTPNGKKIKPVLINGKSSELNHIGGIYVYDTLDDDGLFEEERSLHQSKSLNKFSHLKVPVGNVQMIIEKSHEIQNNLYVLKHQDVNLVLIICDEMSIMRCEDFLPLMYSSKLQAYENKRYILINRHKCLDLSFYNNILSVVLKVRAMENYCAVILESDSICNCYQTGKNKNAQVLEENNGYYEIDLGRTSGPEAIWKNKGDYSKAEWRKGFEWLIDYSLRISDNV